VREVARRFGSVRRVAAVSFHRHVAGIDQAARHRVGVDPILGVVDLICELARRAQSDRQCARALLGERIGAQLDSTQVVDVDDIRISVPLGPVLFDVARPVTDLAPERLYDVVALMVDTALDYAMTRPDAAPAAVAELVLRLLPQT